MMSKIIKTDKDLFAVYQTIYSDADIEMWYDWNARLNDTKWTDSCYFLVCDQVKIGGAIIKDDMIMFPFLIPPYSDRIGFWRELLFHGKKSKINGVTDCDCRLLPMFGYHAVDTRQIMCRPVDKVPAELPRGFFSRSIGDMDMDEVGNVIYHSYRGSIDFELYGEGTLGEAVEDAKRVIGIYSSHNQSICLLEEGTEKVIGICLAGIGENYVNGYAEIADICTLPEYRGRGLAKYMLAMTINSFIGQAPFIKLAVTIGNPAEYLYHSIGFQKGPRFTNLIAGG